jgi:uncharacterized RDD family membrane protein YckC/Tfp pilus assembly protein PilE
MLCTNCGATNADDAKVCKSCQQPLSGVWQSPKSELVGADAAAEGYGYAGFWERLAALILDNLLLGVVTGAISVGLGLAVARGGSSTGMVIAFYVVPLLLGAAYFVSMESGARGATFGKRALKLRVVDASGARITPARALGRYVAHALSYITLYIGYLIQPFTERKQALHDMVSGMVVVRTEKNSSSLAIVIAVLAALFVLLAVIGILAAVAIPAYQDYVVKSKMFKAEATGRMATQAVENYAAQTGKIPASLAETGVNLPAMREVDDVTVNPQDGEVQVVFAAGMGSRIAGKALVFDATRGADGKIVWTCSGPGIAANMLPPDCR